MKRTVKARSMEFPKKSPDDEQKANTLRLRKVTWHRVKRVAEVEGESMNAATDFLITWALDDWDQTQARRGSAKRSTDPLEGDDEKPDAPRKRGRK